MNRNEMITILFNSVEAGEVTKVKEILVSDPTLVQEYNHEGMIILGYAAYFGHQDVVKVILDIGAEVNALSKSKVDYIPSNTALHAAIAGKRDMKVINLLLDRGARTAISDSNGHSCLHVAAFHDDNNDLIDILIRHGANVNHRDQTGKTALDLALEQGNENVAKMLQKIGNMNDNNFT